VSALYAPDPEIRKPKVTLFSPTARPAVVSGILMIMLAVVWFCAGLAVGVIFFYPPILLLLGLISLVKGLTGQE
jgi:hypothetical protein